MTGRKPYHSGFPDRITWWDWYVALHGKFSVLTSNEKLILEAGKTTQDLTEINLDITI